MTRRCTVCDHKRRKEIDRILVERSASYRDLAKRFKLTTGSLYRHYAEHIPADLALAVTTEKADYGANLLQEVLDLKDRAKGLMDKAEADADYRTAGSLIGQARQCIELLAKLEGKLQEGPTVNIHMSGEWVQIQTVILQALAPHEAARKDVVEALSSVRAVA